MKRINDDDDDNDDDFDDDTKFTIIGSVNREGISH